MPDRFSRPGIAIGSPAPFGEFRMFGGKRFMRVPGGGVGGLKRHALAFAFPPEVIFAVYRLAVNLEQHLLPPMLEHAGGGGQFLA